MQGPCTYYVRSAQQQHQTQQQRGNPRYRSAAYEHTTTTYYEVRLTAWSCSCPAFTFSAFPAPNPNSNNNNTNTSTPTPPHAQPGRQDWCIGGLSAGENMPVCKHLLACVLVEHSSTFAHLVEERTITLEELAGWAAGWGD